MRNVQILKRVLKDLASKSGTLQIKFNKFFLQYKNMLCVITEERHAFNSNALFTNGKLL